MRQEDQGYMVKYYERQNNAQASLKESKLALLNEADSVESVFGILKDLFRIEGNRHLTLSTSMNPAYGQNFSKIPKVLPLRVLTRGFHTVYLISEVIQPATTLQKPQKQPKAITSYAFYEDGEKFVKVILNLSGVEEAKPEQIETRVSLRQLEVKVNNFKNENYIFKVTRTHNKYVTDAISYVLKKDKIIVKITKQNPGDNVFTLHKQKMIGEVPSDDEK
jgi:hypothetical protein